MKLTAAIIGASAQRHKYGNMAVRAFARQGYDVYPIHPRADSIEGRRAYPSILDVPVANLDIISIYLPPDLGLTIIDDVAKKGAREVWLNPGAESPELVDRARALGLNVIVACSIVGIGTSPYQVD
ncbi:MAG: CoA-binding protein [Gemmataceae bacterium]|nr:CoA-binding protein [Gemmataceae bacterium]